MTAKTWGLLGALVAIAAMGCATKPPSQFIVNKQNIAIETALKKGRAVMNCPEATGAVLSRTVDRSPLDGPWDDDPHRTDFTVGVAGCNKYVEFLVICPLAETDCFAETME